MRRGTSRALTTAARATPTMALVGASQSQLGQRRNFSNAFDIFLSLVFCGACMTCFACWGNNLMNVKKLGLYRFRYMIDETLIPLDFRMARYLGAFFGLWFWWTQVGPKKYERTDIEQWTTRVGPF